MTTVRRAAAVVRKSIRIPTHLSLPPLRCPALNIAHGKQTPGHIEHGTKQDKNNVHTQDRNALFAMVLAVRVGTDMFLIAPCTQELASWRNNRREGMNVEKKTILITRQPQYQSRPWLSRPSGEARIGCAGGRQPPRTN